MKTKYEEIIRKIAKREGFTQTETNILLEHLEQVENGMERFIADYSNRKLHSQHKATQTNKRI